MENETNRKSILFISHEININGSSKSLMSIINRIKSRYDVHVLVRERSELSEILEQMNCKVIVKNFHLDVEPIKPSKKLDKYIWPVRVVRYKLFRRKMNDSVIRSMSSYVKQNNIALVHSNSSATFVGAYIAKLSGVPHIWHFREFLQEDFYLYPLTGWNYFYKLASQAKTVICVSDAIRDKYKDLIDTKLVTAHNAIEDPDLYGIVRPEHANINLLQAGVISVSKGVDTAIKAVIHLKNEGKKNVHLFLAGNGTFDGLDELLAEAGEQVHMVGYINDMNKFRIDNAIDVELVCSRQEGFGRNIIEAMAMGIPVIGTNKGGPREIIEHNHTGYLFEYGNYETLAEYILRLEDRELCKRMGDDGHDLFVKKFTMQRLTETIFEIYNEALAK